MASNVQTTENCNQVLSYLCFFDKIGIAVYYLTTNLEPTDFIYFTTHFFKRYRERLKLNHEKPEELVKHFVKKNIFMIPHAQENEGEQPRVFTRLDSGAGLGLGIYHDEDDIYEFKTFVDESLLTQNQKNKMAEILIKHAERFNKELEKRLPRILHNLGVR